jgi:hypothetical protein
VGALHEVAVEKAVFPVAPRDAELHSGSIKTNLKPANSKARALLKKLLALAERGIDGEKTSAQRKIRRLKARFDFCAPEPAETPDLFSGSFKPSATARPIYAFGPNEFEVANSVKWAIESATGIRCVYRDRLLLAEASPATARRLEEIALHIASSFRALLDKFSAVGGVSPDDRGVFVRGLYDGMMNETRNAGQPLPSRPGLAKRQRGRKHAAPRAAIHLIGRVVSLRSRAAMARRMKDE